MKNKKSAEFLLNYSWEGKTKGKYSGMDLDSYFVLRMAMDEDDVGPLNDDIIYKN